MGGAAVLTRPRTAAWLAGAIAVTAGTLLVLRTPSYDPTGWLIWGRQIAHGQLHTTGGPSWKPLPVVFTTLFAYAGSSAAPLLWLFLARAGGLLALVLGFRLARRLGGRAAGVYAVLGLLLTWDLAYNALRGDSEAWLVAFGLGAALCRLDGRERSAFLLVAAATLLRPEVAVVLAPQAAWLLWTHRGVTTLAVVAVSAAVVVGAWLVPELIGSGDALRAAARATNPVPGSPAQSPFPLGFALLEALAVLPWPLYAGAIARTAAARRATPRSRADRLVLAVVAAAGLLTLTIAALSETGFSGGHRYFTLPAAGFCVIGAAGLPTLVESIRARRSARLAVTAGLAAAVALAGSLGLVAVGALKLRRDEGIYGHEMPALIAAFGGRQALRACGPVSTTPFERQTLAYLLRLPQQAVTTHPRAHGTLLGRRGTSTVLDSPMRRRIRTAHLAIRSDCAVSAGRARRRR